jgi:hypothetical protein
VDSSDIVAYLFDALLPLSGGHVAFEALLPDQRAGGEGEK